MCLSGYPAGQFAVFMAPTEPRPLIISATIAARGEIASRGASKIIPYSHLVKVHIVQNGPRVELETWENIFKVTRLREIYLFYNELVIALQLS